MICISTSAETAEELRTQILDACECGDAAEVRFDYLPDDERQKALEMIGSLDVPIRLIATFRSPEQGGRGNATLEDRVKFWQNLPNGYFAADME